MTDKFNYIDLLMYVVPGVFLTSTLLLAVCLVIPATVPYVSTNFLSSIVFLIFSFILGNLVQGYSHKGPETRLKEECWGGHYPSQLMFFPNNKVVNDQGRADLLEACQSAYIFNDDDISAFSCASPYPQQTLNKGQNAFDYMRVFLEDKPGGRRIRGAEGYYLFFRGMFVVSAWAAVAFAFVVVSFAARTMWPIINEILGCRPSVLVGLILPLAGVLTCLIFWRVFRYRCRGAAEGFPREVCRAFCAEALIAKKAKGKRDMLYG